MPWREDTRPYYVLVSEIMLQQTQVERVIPKFNEFITLFPSVEALVSASLSDVLVVWNGLGYNRRAKFLHSAAQMIVAEYNGVFPEDPKELLKLPGVGVNTAGALVTYSFNKPAPFIETNIRTVYFHHFFKDEINISDSELLQLVSETMDREHSREWYWALMDYGAFLKRSGAGLNDKSRHYKKQSPLKGSVREVRGQLVKTLTKGEANYQVLRRHYKGDERFEKAFNGLLEDGIIARQGPRVHLTGAKRYTK